MTEWIAAKLQYITDEFLAGGGNGQVFECAFLCYIECREAMRGNDPKVVWIRFNEQQREVAGEGRDPVALSSTITDRQELVDALLLFARRFEGPRSQRIRITPSKEPAQIEPTGRAEEESADLLDFLSGDDE